MTKQVYKIATVAEWERALAHGWYTGSDGDIRDGFIHLSTAEQLRGTFERYFSGQSGLVLIAFEAEKLAPGLRWEPARGGDLFPHHYGDLAISLALWQRTLALDQDGTARLDEDWLKC